MNRTRRRLLAGTTGLAGLMGAACGQIGGPPATTANVAAQRNAALEVWIHGESHAEW
jgi:hypothetical protein